MKLYQGEWKTSLVGYWGFNEGTGTAVDEPISGLDGIITPVTTDPAWLTANTGIKPMCQASATLGSGLSFDGTSKGYVTVADNDLLSFGDGTHDTTPFTFSMWIKMSDFVTNRQIICKYDSGGSGFGIEYDLTINGSKLLWIIHSGGASSPYLGRSAPCTSALYNGIWIHVVVTYDASEANSGLKIYINGIQKDNANASSGTYVAMSNTQTPFRVGIATSNKTTFALPFLGSFDELILWSRVLSTTEITQLYKQGTNAKAFENFNRLLITDGKLPLDMPLVQE